MREFAGKVAVVTGGASGIGLALARRFLDEGMRVMLADIERAALDAAEKELTETFGADRVGALLTDVRDAAAVEMLAEGTFDRFGTAHVVCNNAGVAVGGFTWTIADDRWRWIVDVNLMGVVNGIRAFVPRMVEQGEGHVINTASMAGLVTAPLMSPYVATKHAVVGLSESLYMDLRFAEGEFGVSVLCPGWVRTNIADSERNRPEDVSPSSSDYVEMLSEIELSGSGGPSMLQSMVEQGMEPAGVAGKVVDAIRTGRFWVLTHETSLDAVEQRFQAIRDDGHPVFSTF